MILKTAVLISGRGSNLQALLDDAKQPGAPAWVEIVISNVMEAAGLDRARAAGVAAEVINHKSWGTREAFERELDARLTHYKVELVCLAGFMRLLTPWFVDRWRDKLINIHPSLLPAYPGLDTHKRALEAGDQVAGCTVHFVRAEMDHGPMILQASVPILAGDTEATLTARVLEAEHKIYPQAVRLIAEGRVNVFEENVFITGADAPAKLLVNPR